MEPRVSFRVNKKPQIRKGTSALIMNAKNHDWGRTSATLTDLEDNLTQHFTTRGGDLEHIKEHLRRLRWLTSSHCNRKSEWKERRIIKHTKEMINKISVIPSNGEDGLSLFYLIQREVTDDFRAFQRDPSDETLSALFDDLDNLDTIEPAMRKIREKHESGEDIYDQYRTVLDKKGECEKLYGSLNAMATPSLSPPKDRNRVFDTFGELFSEMNKLRAPEGFKYRAEEEAISPEQLQGLEI